MLIYYTDRFVLPLPPGHRFPMRKYAALRERVAAVAGPLLREPAGVSDDQLVGAHDPAYIAAVSSGTLEASAQRRIGFPWSPEMVERSRRSAGARSSRRYPHLPTARGLALLMRLPPRKPQRLRSR
jgi:acetoin utilization deacetylase AcuC-like enzyme